MIPAVMDFLPRRRPAQVPVALLEWARLHGHRAIGIEIEERYCELAARRLSQGVLEAFG